MAEPTPDIDGFLDGLSRFQQEFGREVTFNFLGDVTFPPGTEIDPETGQPYDPTASGASGAATASAVPALVVTQAIQTPGNEATPIGRIETGQIALIIDQADWSDALADADSVDVLGESYEVVRDDEDAVADRPPHRHIVVIQQR